VTTSADTFDSRVQRLEEDVRELMRIVVKGNGHESLVVRVVKLEDALKFQTKLLGWILGVATLTAIPVLSATIVWVVKRLTHVV
jgi:hypothetical protein